MCRLLFIMSMAHFSMPNSVPNHLLYILSLLKVFQFFFVFGKQFDVVHVHQVVDLFLRFSEFVSGCVFLNDMVEWHHNYHK